MNALEVPADAHQRIAVALAMIDAIDAQTAPLERELRQLARGQTGCKALMRLYGDERLRLSRLSSEHLVGGSPLDMRSYFASLRERPGGRRGAAVSASHGRPAGTKQWIIDCGVTALERSADG